jgi:hypothetical protein
LAEPNRTSSRGQKGQILPITRHPLFPAIVALWFFVLLGMGSFAVSISALESLVHTLHIELVAPALAPPLGTTARLALALSLGAIGAAIGWVLARRIGARQSVPAPTVFKVADLDETLPWPGLADTPAIEDETWEPRRPSDDLSDMPLADMTEPACAMEAEPAISPGARLAPPMSAAAQRLVTADLDMLSHLELVERLAIALQHRYDRLGQAAHAPDPVIPFPGLPDRQSLRVKLASPHSRPAPQETEKALRDALARLQKMSGSA